MKKLPLLLWLIIGYNSVITAQETKITFSNTLPIRETDSPELIIEKAAHVIPTPKQMSALQNEFIAFIHFGPNTFTRMEWGSGTEDPKIFDLKSLDTDQWCEALKAAGMKMVILTVKHHDGFVLWQSRYTKHGIMSSPFENGQGDILKSLSESCEKYGLKLGVYLSPADLYQIENAEGLYGNRSRYSKRTIPRDVPGRPFKNKTTFEFELDDYNEYFMNQLFEILTEYGKIHEVWFDGAHPKTKGGQRYNYSAWKKLIHTLAPEAVVFGREDIRWCGNEAGQTRQTEWNVIPYSANPDTMTYFADMTKDDLGSREQLYGAKYLHYQQAETNTSIREGWFYRDDTHQKVRSTDDVFDIYERAVGGNSTFLLNIPPNREGLFSPRDVAVLKEVGQRIQETYGTNLLLGAKDLDNNLNTSLKTTEKNRDIYITTPQPITLNRLLIQEAISTHGERVEEHAVDAWINNEWKEIARASNIGYKRILRFPEVTTSQLRIRIIKSRLDPAISCVSAHYYHSRPPQLTSHRSIDGLVSIQPIQPEFNWKDHGEDILQNLNAGFKIYYTTDGQEPSVNSFEYRDPVQIDNKELKAVSVLNNQLGAVHSYRYGLIKQHWKIVESNSKNQKHPVTMAIDENPESYWISESGKNHTMTIDLGEEHTLRGFAYTPQNKTDLGMMAKGIVEISNDGNTWQQADRFEFGNLINDPSKREHRFTHSVKARYVRITATEIARGNKLYIAEIDLF